MKNILLLAGVLIMGIAKGQLYPYTPIPNTAPGTAIKNYVSVGASTTVPNPRDAWLVIGDSATSKAMIVPRVVSTATIANPRMGMVIYSITDSSLYVRRKNEWLKIGAGGVSPCLTTYQTFEVGILGDPQSGDTLFTDTDLIDKQIKVYRDGDLQYETTDYLYNSLTGAVDFNIPLYKGGDIGEHVRIEAACNDTTWFDDISLRLFSSPDSNATLYSNAIGATTAQREAIDNYVKVLKFFHVWDDIHFMPTPADATMRYNIKDPRALDSAWYITYVNSPTVSNGIDWNGTNQYGTTSYIPRTLRYGYMVYPYQSTSDTGFIADRDPGGSAHGGYLFGIKSSGESKIGVGDTSRVGPTMDATGFGYGQRKSDVLYQFFDNDSYDGSITTTGYGRSFGVNRFYINGQDFGHGANTAGLRMFSVGNVMDSTKVLIFQQATQAFLSELGIQVGAIAAYPKITSNPENYRHRYRYIAGDTLVFNDAQSKWKDGASIWQFGDSVYSSFGWNNFQVGQTTDTIFASIAAGDVPNFVFSSKQSSIQKRHSHGYAWLGGYYYIIGGDALTSDQKDVWRTNNGRTFTQMTADWGIGPRYLHGACAHGTTTSDSALYVGGGQSNYDAATGTLYDNLYKSTNGGASFTLVASGLSFLKGNISRNMISYKGKLHVVSGGYYYSTSSNNTYRPYMYRSVTGAAGTWDSLALPFTPVQYGEVVEWDDRLWMIGGTNVNYSSNQAGIWYYDEASGWHNLGSPPVSGDWTHATAAAKVTIPGRGECLVIVSGNETNKAYIIDKF